MKEKILEFLKNQQDYISGQELCEYFQVSRTAVWKVIKQLQSEGYDISAVNNKGYKLMHSPDVLTENEIVSGLTTKRLGRKVYTYDVLGSTNDEARKLAEQGAPDGALVVAETQNTGKGRMGRAFFSPKGCGIWMSMILKPDIPPMTASMITLITAMAVSDMLTSYGIRAKIKWPNDLVIDSRKVTGILTEMSIAPDVVNSVIVGIGINVNMDAFPEELAAMAVSMKMVTGETYHRAEVIQRVLKAFEKYYETFLQTGDLAFIRDDYNARMVHKDKTISIHEYKRTWQAVSKGINELGELIVQDAAGEHLIRSGEVSIRGVYGYSD